MDFSLVPLDLAPPGQHELDLALSLCPSLPKLSSLLESPPEPTFDASDAELSTPDASACPDDHQNAHSILSWDFLGRHPGQPVPPYVSPYPSERLPHPDALASLRAASVYCARLSLGLGLKTLAPPRTTGFSCDPTQAICRHARQLGTHLSAIDSCATDSSSLLYSGLGQLVIMLRTEIAALQTTATQMTLVASQIALDPIHKLMSSITNALVGIKSAQDHLDVLYQFTDYLLVAGSLPLIQVVASWLLDRVTVRLLIGWETWLGLVRDDDKNLTESCTRDRRWPHEYDEIYQRLWHECGIERVKDNDQHESSHSDITAMTKPDAQYILKLDRVPKFFPAQVARKLFEAGIALRILRRSGVEERSMARPVCLLHPIGVHERARWVWTPDDLKHSQIALKKQAREVHIQTSAWRNRIRLPGTYSPESPVRPKFETNKPSWLISDDRKDELDNLLAHLKSGFRPDVHSSQASLLTTSLSARLRAFRPPALLSSLQLPSLATLTAETVFKPLVARAAVIHSSLLSFFLVDMDLLSHLAVLARFFLCTDHGFTQRLAGALFVSPDLHVPGVSLRLLDRAHWPPSGFDLAAALRTVILDSIPSSSVSGPAAKALEDRLSFATAEDDWSGAPPHSLDAFGFLCLDFKPPAGLRPLLPSDVLEDYRHINGHLMKLIRLQSVMREVCMTLRGRMPYHHRLVVLVAAAKRLLDGVVAFTWDVAIGINWRGFVDELARTRTRILERERWPAISQRHDEQIDEAGEKIKTVEELNGLHRQMLTDMKNSLFLRNRQKHFAVALQESVFDPILQLASLLSSSYSDSLERLALNEDARTAERRVVQEMWVKQRNGVSKLFKALERLRDRAADRVTVSISGNGRGGGSGNGFLSEFLGCADWNRFYADWYGE